MEKLELAEMLHDKLDNMNIQFYKKLLDNSTYLIRHDILNRMIILSQNINATDVRTEDEWVRAGVDIIDYDNSINIIEPIIENKYIDSVTGKEVSSSELNHPELVKALEMGIVTKEAEIESISIIKAYDVKSTSKKNVSKRMKVTLDEILNSMCNEKEVGKINISSEKKKVNAILNKVMSMYSVSEYDEELIRSSIEYSICTLAGLHIKPSFSESDLKEVQSVLCYVDDANCTILNSIELKGITDASVDIQLINKAKFLLNILTAHTMYKQLKG